MGECFKKNIGALWRNPFLVVCQIHLNQRSDQLLSGCLICWSKARRWLIKRRGKWWSSWRPTSGWFRTFGAGGQQPGGGLGPSETISLPACQVSCPNPKPLKTHLHTVHSPPHYRHNHHPHSQTTPLNDGISFDFWDNVLILSLSIEKL